MATQARGKPVERKSLSLRKAADIALVIIGSIGFVAVILFMGYLIATANLIDG